MYDICTVVVFKVVCVFLIIIYYGSVTVLRVIFGVAILLLYIACSIEVLRRLYILHLLDLCLYIVLFL